MIWYDINTVLIACAYYLAAVIAVIPLSTSTWPLWMIFLKSESEIFLLVNPFLVN